MPTLFQSYVVMALFYYGIIFGFVYEIKVLLQKLSKTKWGKISKYTIILWKKRGEITVA